MPAAQAVEALIAQYGNLVFHTIYGLTGDWEDSQDLTQDTFHQALKAIDAARAKSGAQFHAKAWLLRIAVNTVRMQRRRQNLFRFIPFSRFQREQKEKAYKTDSDLLSDAAAPVQPAGYGASGTSSNEGGNIEVLVAERDAVQRTMARLSEPLRVCLLLSVVGSFSTIEIAEMLDLEEAAVRQRLVRARKQFQQLYALESGEEVVDSVGADKSAVGTKELKRAPQAPLRPLQDAGKAVGTINRPLREGVADKSAMGTINRPLREVGEGRVGEGGVDKQRNSSERVESRISNERRRNNAHAERFHRDPAVTPLW